MAFIVLALVAWASLLTWSIDDPTLTRPGSGPANNLFGLLGAAASDLLLRGFGLASAVAMLPLVFWGGGLLLRQRVFRWRFKLLLWAVGVFCLSGAFAAVPVVQAWRIPHGFGGLTGDFVYAVAGSLLSFVSAAHGPALAGLALLAGGASALFASLGAGRRELAMIWHGDDWHRHKTFGTAPPPARSAAWHGAAQQGPAGLPGATTAPSQAPSQATGSSLLELAANLWRHRPGRADRSAMRRVLDNAAAQQPAAANFSRHSSAMPMPYPPMPAQGYGSGPAHAFPQGEPLGDVYPGSAPYPADPNYDPALSASLDLESRAIAARFAPRGGVANDTPVIENPPEFADRPPYRPQTGPAPSEQMSLPFCGPAGAPPGVRIAQARPFGPSPVPAAPISPVQAPQAAALAAQPARGFLRGWKGRSSQRHTGQAYRPPALTLLKRAAAAKPGPEYSQNVQRGVAKLLEDVLADFGIKGQIQAVKPGPVVTLYELEPARGVKSSRIVGLSDDIARSMSATSARVAGVPGRNVIGIELPNMRRETVYLRELLETEAYQNGQCTLPVVLGKSIGGEPIVADLARMPHVLVAGTTGSGKSVGINAMILSLLYRLGPEQCRFLMIDPKMLELSVYNGIPHLLAPVITEPHKAVAALNWVVREMEERYKRMAQLSVRNIEVFNGRIRQAAERGEELSRTVQTGFDPMTGEPVYETERMQLEAMPYIVVVVDEMADLMLTAGKDIEGAVQRLAQMARAAGIHLIMATQRPSVDVITGTIKANFPTRISFKVTSKIDSRTILGEQGAEQLLGAGDMLFSTGTGQIVRVHGPFVADEEVEQIAAYLRTLGEPAYVDGIGEDEAVPGELSDEPARDESEDIYDKAVAVVLRDRKASTSYIQRRLSIGYNRAADIMERMEAEGLVSAANSVGKRNILVGEARAS